MANERVPSEGIALTHIYGVVGVISGVATLLALFGPEVGWRDYALIASGWFAAAGYAFLLLKAINSFRADFREACSKIGKLRRKIAILEQQNDQALGLSSALLQMQKPPPLAATPRVVEERAIDGQLTGDAPSRQEHRDATREL